MDVRFGWKEGFFPTVQLTALSLTLLLLLSRAAPEASVEERTLPSGCNETAVIARVENHSIDLIESKNDLIGHGWVTATLKVKAVVKGPKVPDRLTVRYFAHTYMRQDRDFMLVLHQTDQGFVITGGQVMSVRRLPLSLNGVLDSSILELSEERQDDPFDRRNGVVDFTLAGRWPT